MNFVMQWVKKSAVIVFAVKQGIVWIEWLEILQAWITRQFADFVGVLGQVH